MGRPPSSSAQSPSRSVPSHNSLSSRSKVRQFVIDFPPTPAAIAQAIRRQRRPHKQQRTLTTKLHKQRAEVDRLRSEIRRVEQDREKALRTLRLQHQTSTAQAVAALAEQLRTQHDAPAARIEFEERCSRECEAKRKEWTAEFDAIDTKPMEERVAILEAAAKETTDTTEKQSEGMVAAICQPAIDAVEIKSEKLKEVQKEREVALEKITETRSELIWLLKQVIKAEEKLKSESKKPPVTIK